MKRKMSVSLVVAAVLLLAMATLGVAATRFGLLESNCHQADNETYIAHILAVDEVYENEYMTLLINDAVFDGTYLSLTMDVQPKENCGEGVYLYPSMTAQTNGKTLTADVESCCGDFFNGFWVPERDESLMHANGRYGVEYSISTEDMKYDAWADAVTWTMNLDIIKPVYRVESLKSIFDGDHTKEEYLAYEQRFRQAYENQTILLEDGYSIFEYVSVLPRQSSVSEKENGSSTIPYRLVDSGAFEWVDRVQISFTTEESGIKELSEPQTFDLGDYEVTVNTLLVSFGHCDYEMELVKKPGKGKTAGQEFADGDPQWYFAVLADGCRTQPDKSGQGLKYGTPDNPSAEMLYQGTVILTEETDSVTFVPCLQEAEAELGEYEYEAVYGAQRPVTPEQEELAFTIRFE